MGGHTVGRMSWRSYHFYEDRSSGLPERIVLADELGREAYVAARERTRRFGRRRLLLRDLVENKRGRLQMKALGSLTYDLLCRNRLHATIGKTRLRSRDRFLLRSADGTELTATAPHGSGQYTLSELGRGVARLTARPLESPPELQVADGTDRFLVVAAAIVIYLFEYHPGRA